ncbi:MULTISPECIES: ABC transporter permease [Microbacterium]|uniref:ABC transporter permease n=1 Tax=Microbacterium wangchenii TaxID=2541726 RepID=A0ABX5SYP4_9MICO|nr:MULTISPECIES: ABC transporter permease [Microbacterium]MCK6066088.1 ABC transporter permease [Microbacterium sp. EYE_512]QBR90370.1 ABC transporter permease [Microbacterium wangchenii]
MSTTPSSPSEWQSAWLVAEREIGSKLRSKAFVISSAILLIAALASVLWGGFAAANSADEGIPVAVTSQTERDVEGLEGLDVTVADDADAATELVADGTVDAALLPDDSGTGFDFKIVADDGVPSGLMAMLSQSPTVELLDPSGGMDGILRYFVALGFGIVFLMAASIFGSTIATSVVEEKQTRVVEILISAIPVRSLLAGKVIGNTILAMAQIIALAAIAVVGLSITGQTEVLAGLGAPLLWFAVFFFFGFVLLAALFAAAGAMVSRQEDIGATTTPLTMLIMAPYFLVIFFNDNPLVLGIMSYVPFSAPVGMPLRQYLGTAEWWEPIVSLVILAATCVAAIWVGARIYQNSLLRMGARVKLAEALRG